MKNLLLFYTIILILLPCIACASGTLPISQLSPINGVNYEEFGYSADLSGATSIVGARNDGPGSAYIFERSTPVSNDWLQTSKLIPSDGVAFDEFGTSVSISGNVAIVGSPSHGSSGSHTGAAYVYLRAGSSQPWTQLQILQAGDLHQNAFFANSVVVQGNLAIIGAYKTDSNLGAVYVFQSMTGDGRNWAQVDKIHAPAGAAGFGAKVDIDGSNILVGASTSASDFGSAYIYRQGGSTTQWNLVSALPQPEAGFGDEYGDSVSLSGQIAVVGAHRNIGNGNQSGAIYIFDQNAGGTDHWGLVQRFAPSDVTSNGFFGWSLGVDHGEIAVGAPLDNSVGTASGSAYLLDTINAANSWSVTAKVIPPQVRAQDQFGNSVRISEGNVIAGAPYNRFASGGGPGSAYVIQIVPEPHALNLLVIAVFGSMLGLRWTKR